MVAKTQQSDPEDGGRELWGTRIGVILAVAGSAVGLGNFLRFPGNAAENGGGAFMLPYFVSLLVIGIPLCWAEWTMGRYGGTKGFNSAPGIFSVLWPNPTAKYVGAFALLIPLIIYMYYVLVEAWCLGYAIKYLSGDLMREGKDPKFYKNHLFDFIGANEDGALFSPGNWPFLLTLLACFAFNFFLIYRGVTKGIERFCRIAMPLMVILALIVLVRVLTLGAPVEEDQNVVTGLGFMWNPVGDKLTDPQTWLAASGQIFFSLSVGFGIIINYASYLRKNDDVVLSGLTSSSMNEFFEVCLGGLITLPAAFIFLGPAVAGLTGSNFSLGFIALPNVFAAMPGGQLFGFLWFFMLFVAAITSSVSMLQPVIAFFEEGLGLKRHAAAAILGLLSALGCGFVAWFSRDTKALDTMDFWVGTFLIFILAMLQAVIYGWIFGIKKGDIEAHQGAHIRIPRFVQFMLKYITPAYLLVVFFLFCFYKLPSSDTLLTEIDAPSAKAIATGDVPEAVRETLAASEIEIPAESVVAGDLSTTLLVKKAAAGPTIVFIEPVNDKFGIYQHKAGQFEGILNSPVAFSSVCFIAVVFAFLLILVRIAGERWEQEGRFRTVEGSAS
ncbi:MAG: sodium:calcium symporter [Planctomycetota bacterium]|nr:MAG: sodium:calcium symporter [Planctomycetota bacterium]REK43227.1 MAG: sodium:calcium symporter [Planctomycetota bacterium]